MTQRNRRRREFAAGLLLLVGAMPALCGSRAAVPDNGTITLTDYGYRHWGPELVRYRLDTRRFVPGRLELVDSNGRAVPFQIVNGRESLLEFVAAVRKGETATYTLRRADEDRSRENSAIVRATRGDQTEIGNEFFALRIPAAAKKTFEEPVPASRVPAPIIAWRQNGWDWMGGAHFFTERKVAAYELGFVDDGPASVAFRARYAFYPRGEYSWEVRVSTGVPVALVTEEYDFGEITEGRDFLMLGIGENWKPDQISFLDKLEPIGPYLDAKSKEHQGPVKSVGSYPPPPLFVPGEHLVPLEKIVPGGTWGLKPAIELRLTKTEGSQARVCSISACPYHTGSWRRTNSLIAWYDPARGVQLALPISVRTIRWYLDLTDDASPFSSHEHDPDLSPSYGRRVWGLGFGLSSAVEKLWPGSAPADPIVTTRTILGYIGLDRYKDWIIAWPEDKAKSVYPRGILTPKLAARLRNALDQHPEKELLQKLYVIDGKPETAVANAKAALEGFQGGPCAAEWQVFGLTGYIQTYQLLWTIYANSALSCPTLPAALRTELRRRLALHAYLFSEPDYNPRGAGCHLGNPNMPIGRTTALATMAPLIPDHPMYPYWMTQLEAITAFRLATNTEPGGAWFEPPTYQFYGPTRALNYAQIVLRNEGFRDLAEEGWHKAALAYDANLTVPEPRCKGWRVFPGMGNSGLTLEGIFGISVATFDRADRDFAGYMRYMHKLCSGNHRLSLGSDPDYSACYLPDIPEKPRTLKTTFVPGYGVCFRAHYGSPDETAMLFRSGYNKSHWDMDDLNVILYAKGAPLSPGTGYQYYYGPANEKDAIYHNRVKVGKLDAHEPFGRVENTIQDYGFGDEVDYALGREYYPPEYFDDNKREMEWRRHILFLKSRRPDGANYFVMRDTFPGGEERPTWWHWLNLDTADLIYVDGRAFDKDKTPLNKAVPEAEMPTLTGSTLEFSTKYGAATHVWFASGEPLTARAVMTFDYQVGPNYHHRVFGSQLGVISQSDKEAKTILRLSQKVGRDYFYVVYPRKDSEKLPVFTRLGSNCIKAVTAEATDYCFVGDAPEEFQQEDVTFTGKAGAVRIFPDRVVLSMASGSGRIGYKGYVLEGHGPFERTVRLASLKAGKHKVGGYEKKIVAIDLGRGITVTGEAPFEATLDGQVIRIKTSGRARVLTLTKPAFIVRPELRLDGRQWMAGWSDEAGSDWGRWSRTQLIAVSTLDGKHELTVRDMVFPKVWERQFEPSIETALMSGAR